MNILFISLAILALVAISLSISTAIIYFAWNIVVVYLFGMPEITTGMALLIVLVLGLIGGCFKTTITQKQD